MIKKIICGIKNLRNWFPIIWQDRDWDFEFILIILREKLSNVLKHFDSLGEEHSNVEAIQTLRKVLTLLDKYDNISNHEDKRLIELRKKYGETIFSTKKTGLVHVTFANVKTEEDLKIAKKAHSELHEILEEEKNKALIDAFYLIGKYIQFWWD